MIRYRPVSDAKDLYKQACEFDRDGREREAAALYIAALKLGLDGDDRAGALLGLGSTLRNLGRVKDSVRILAAACHTFPQHVPMRVFLALALHDAGMQRRALAVALDVLLAAADLKGYERALREYRDALQ